MVWLGWPGRSIPLCNVIFANVSDDNSVFTSSHKTFCIDSRSTHHLVHSRLLVVSTCLVGTSALFGRTGREGSKAENISSLKSGVPNRQHTACKSSTPGLQSCMVFRIITNIRIIMNMHQSWHALCRYACHIHRPTNSLGGYVSIAWSCNHHWEPAARYKMCRTPLMKSVRSILSTHIIRLPHHGRLRCCWCRS